MNIKTTEASLAKYHVLHLAVGFSFALILLLVPKIIGVVICTILLALALPAATLPEFVDKKYLGGILIVAGALVAYALIYGLHKL